MSTQHASPTVGSGSTPSHRAEDTATDRIDRIQTRLLDVPLGTARGGSGATRLQLVHVLLTSANGATGTGFSYSLGPGCEAVHALLTSVHAPAVLDIPLTDWARRWYELRAATARLGRGVTLPAISAVDIAVWDLRARLAGVPLATLLGALRDQVPIYGSGRASHAMSDAELRDGALSYVAEGYRAIKLRVGSLPAVRDLARLSAVREAVGPDVEIMVDCNERLDLATAQWLGPRLHELGVRWLEEPLPAADVEGYRVLAQRCPVPLAAGEHLLGLEEFVPYLSGRTTPIAQPDAPLTGGVSECVRIAVLAEAHGATLAPHFLPELHVHLAASARTATWVEHFPLLDPLLSEVLRPTDGMVRVPARPGHGMRWDPGALEHFTVHRFDSGARR